MRPILTAILLALACLLALAALTPTPSGTPRETVILEGPCLRPSIEVGPFDLHRRYRSMEGPYVSKTISFNDLISSQKTVIPESEIAFTEAGPSASMTATPAPSASRALGERSLFWVKGLRLQVLDENGKALPTAEFICHTNVDVDPSYRNATFTEGEPCTTSRIFTVTQGQTEIMCPDGFGIPVTSDEKWTFTFQAANRTTGRHRRVKHLCTLVLIKDTDLVQPITALSWFVPYVTVVVDRNTAAAARAEHDALPNCLPSQRGVQAPNAVPDSIMQDRLDRRLSGHFVVPPGRHTYHSPIVDEFCSSFASRDRTIHMVWSHVHPWCTDCSIVSCRDHKPIVTARVKTQASPAGVQLTDIELISSTAGIPLKGRESYEIEATYENQTQQPVDSMVSMGVFCADSTFVRPKLLLPNQGQVFCNVPGPDRPPLFDSRQDGPLLSAPRRVTVETSAGPLHIVLEPALAPRHATQIHRLLTSGVYDNTPFVRYQPDFVLQLAGTDGADLTAKQKGLLRRLPLEAEKGRHRKLALTMGRDDDPDSAVSSFSILLADAPHLDRHYTVFGHVLPDAVSRQTLRKLTSDYREGKFAIVRVK